MLGPEVEVLGQPVGGRRVGEVRRLAELLQVALEDAGDRIAADVRGDRVGDRRFERLVVHRERPVAHHGAGEQARCALRVHDERADHARLRRRRDVRNVVAGPLLAVPRDDLAARIPRLAVQVGRGAVVEDAPVGRPGERPLRIEAGIVGIAGVPPRHVVAVLVEAAGIDPAAAGRRAVVAQLREAGHLLALLDQHLGRVGRIVDRLDGVAVDLVRDLVGLRIVRIGVGPAQIEDRVGKRPALLLVERLQPQTDLRHDPGVVLGLARRRTARPMPLQPAARVGERPLVLGEAGRGQLDDLGLDLRMDRRRCTRRGSPRSGTSRSPADPSSPGTSASTEPPCTSSGWGRRAAD